MTSSNTYAVVTSPLTISNVLSVNATVAMVGDYIYNIQFEKVSGNNLHFKGYFFNSSIHGDGANIPFYWMAIIKYN